MVLASSSISEQTIVTSSFAESSEDASSLVPCKVYSSNISSMLLNMDNVGQKLQTYERENMSSYQGPCSKWTQDESIHGPSIVSQWDLVCDRVWLRALAISVHLIGQFFGCLIGGPLSDRFGRSPVGRGAIIVSLIMPTIMSFCPIFPVLLVTRLLSGGSDYSLYVTYCTICSEILSTAVGCTDTAIHFSIGALTALLTGYLFPNWTDMTVANTIISTLLCTPAFFLPESLRWLYSAGKQEQGADILKWMAKF